MGRGNKTDMNKLFKDLRFFDHFPETSNCILCGSSLDEPCILVSIDGTEVGNICQSEPVHITCMVNYSKWQINKSVGIIYARGD
jgi:hypothetical protein